MDSAIADVEQAFLYSTNPTLQQIGKMIFNDAEFNEKAIKNLELILMETVNKLTIIGNTSSSNYNEGPSNALVLQILTTMTNTVSNLEVMMAKFQQRQADEATNNAKKYAEKAKLSLQKVSDQLDHLNKLLEQQKKDEQMSKIAGYFMAGAMILLAAATGNIALAAIMLTMTILESTGEMDKFKDHLTTQYTHYLVAHGESEEQAKKDAKILADVTIIAIVATASFGAGAAETTVENALFEGTSTLSKSGLQALTIALQEIASTQITTDIVTSTLSAHTHLSDDEIKKRAMIAEIIADISSMIATLGCGYAMSSATAEEAGLASAMKNLTGDSLGLIMAGSTAIQVSGSMIQVGANIDKANNLKTQATVEEKIGEAKADLTLFQGLQDMSNTLMQEVMQDYEQKINSRQKADSDMLRTMLSYQAEYTKVLSQSA
jgi:hypothetical protein